MSSHANTQRRCLPKYWYFSRSLGGRGRYMLLRLLSDWRLSDGHGASRIAGLAPEPVMPRW